jgi:hypothetical protein
MERAAAMQIAAAFHPLRFEEVTKSYAHKNN